MTFPTYSDQVLVEGHEHLRHFEAQEDVTQGQLVKLDTDDSGRTVEPSDTDGEAAYGFALYDASAEEQVAVAGPGAVVRAVSSTGSITSGDTVASHGGTGDEGEVDTAASGDHVVAVALQDDTGSGTEGSLVCEVVRGIYGNP